MADQAVVHIGENSPERVAYMLTYNIAAMEGFVLDNRPGEDQKTADRKWLLDTYAECWVAVKGRRDAG